MKKIKISVLIAASLFFVENGANAQNVPKWNGTVNTNTLTPIYEDATNLRIGIGTTSPGAQLEVYKDIWVGQDYTNNRRICFGLSGYQAKMGYNSSTGNLDITPRSGYSTVFPAGNLYLSSGNLAVSSGNLTVSGTGSVLFNGTTGTIPTTGAGTRMMWYPAKSAFRAGAVTGTAWDDANIGTGSVAFGNNTTASGLSSAAFGGGTASGSGSAAFGSCIASGAGAVAFGGLNVASGAASAAFGLLSGASGDYSSAFGFGSTAQSFASCVVGQYNVISGTSGSWVATDPLFVIGNGAVSYTPNNALTVLKNGNVGIGTASPSTQLHTTGGVLFQTLAGTGTRIVSSDASGNLSTMTSLSGTGTRMVTADASGNLSTQALPGGSQSLSIVASTITLSGGGGSVTVPSSADNLGNHIATTTLNMNTHSISGISNYIGYTNGAYVYPSGTNDLYTNGALGVGTSASGSGYELYVAGQGYFSGDVNINGTWYSSDKRFKKDITNLGLSTLEKVLSLKTYSYNFDQQKFPKKNFSDKLQFGVLAQEIKEVFPNLVKEDKDGYYAVNYVEIIPLLITAVQEQQKMIDSSKIETAKQLKSLQQQINNLISNNSIHGSNSNTVNTNVDLSDKNVVVLQQNVPNPFAEQTSINYNLPENVTRAQIIFFDQAGKIIKSVDLTEKGKGTLNVFASDLSNGIYTYSLIVDGQTIETKKMVKTK